MTEPARRVTDPEANRRKTREWRARMRAKGLRPVQLWVLDTKSPEFLAEAERQSQAAAASEEERDINAFLDSVSAHLFEE